MARKRQLRKWIVSFVFIALIALSGYALSASGNLRNPLTAVLEFTSLVSGTSAAGGEQGAGSPPTGATRGTPPSGEMQSGGEQSGIQWGQIGSVLYNLWVIAAVSAVMMLVGPVIGWNIKQFGRATKRLTPARAPA